MGMTMDRIMRANFGEPSSKLRVVFKKTVKIREYETEVIEGDVTLNIDKPLTGIERMILCGVIQVQLEYECLLNLYFKNLVTNTELCQKYADLEKSVEYMMNTGEQLSGKSMWYLLEYVPDKSELKEGVADGK